MSASPFDAGVLPLEIPEAAWRLRRCPVCRGALYDGRNDAEGTLTYAVQRQGWVKIGRTAQLEVRLRILRLNGPNGAGMVRHPAAMDYGAPLLLLRTWDGDLEHDLHVRFRADHAAGEWFLPGPELRAFLLEGA